LACFSVGVAQLVDNLLARSTIRIALGNGLLRRGRSDPQSHCQHQESAFCHVITPSLPAENIRQNVPKRLGHSVEQVVNGPFGGGCVHETSALRHFLLEQFAKICPFAAQQSNPKETDMDSRARPYRSVLYIPGSKERALDKARSLPVDAIIFDLEDAVTAEEKENARATLASAIAQGGYGSRMKIVRINGFDTEWGRPDAEAVRSMDVDAVLLPKVGSPADIDALVEITGDLPVWAMMETPRGMLNAAAIAAHPALEGMVMGTNDLAKELQTRFRADRLPMMAGLGLCVLAAKAEGVIIVDGVYNAFKDDEGLRAECIQGRDMGFDGKTLIHPAQVDVANTEFAPSEAEIDLARRQITAFEEIEAAGQGVAVVDGKIVENLHVATAREILAKAEAIEAMQTE
jgi:(3S)-malyl-CoA thioesterase